MRVENLHDWNVTIDQAIELQRKLAGNIICSGQLAKPRLIAGLDVSVNFHSEATAAAVVLNFPELKLVEKSIVRGKVDFPYIPGLLSFREIPLTIQACLNLKSQPDLVLVDGQGIAHPRRIGLASHLGLFLSVPTIGCAKSPLFGSFLEPGVQAGSYSFIQDQHETVIGVVLRTKTGVKPLYVSVGHLIDLLSAIDWVLQCCRGYRLPEPTRMAHLASKGIL